jgi:hypothetical protein
MQPAPTDTFTDDACTLGGKTRSSLRSGIHRKDACYVLGQGDIMILPKVAGVLTV